MKTSKALYSNYFSEYKLDEKTMKRLHDELLSILLDVKYTCDKYGINYMLSYGSCLGAIRHKGFIPWDDDVDIMMLRSEYELFIEKFKQEYSEKYIVAEPLKQDHYFSKITKILKKETTYIEIPTAGIKEFHMIFIDLFIIEKIPNSKFKRIILGKIYNLAYKGSSTCIDYLYPSPIIEEKAKINLEVKKYYRLRKKIGWIFSHLGGIYFWIRVCEKIAKKYKDKDTEMLGILTGVNYGKEIFEKNMFTEVTTTKFCGHEMKIPANYDKYLSNLYGNYMEIPPVEKREAHIAYKIDFKD